MEQITKMMNSSIIGSCMDDFSVNKYGATVYCLFLSHLPSTQIQIQFIFYLLLFFYRIYCLLPLKLIFV